MPSNRYQTDYELNWVSTVTESGPMSSQRRGGASVFYRGMVWLLPLVRSNVIVTCLVHSGACGRFGCPRPGARDPRPHDAGCIGGL